MKRLSCFCLLALLFVQPQPAQAQSAVGYDFLRTLVGARPAAMGGAFVGVSGDIHSVAYNPAGLADIQEKRGTVSYLNHLLDFNSGFLAYAQPLSEGTAAISVNFIDFGTFDRRGEGNEDLGQFSSTGLSVAFSYARVVMPRLSLGATAKYIRFDIDSFTASAVAFDGGVDYQRPDLNLTVGLAVTNLGTTTSAFVDSKDDLPTTVQLGFSKTLEHLPVTISTALLKVRGDSPDFRVGGEITATEQLRLRVGYNSVGQDQKVDTSMDRLAGVSFGLGFKVNKFDIDYSLSSFGEVGALNRFSLVGRF